ncbi:YciI family protein [Actinoplanes friuliensis]
MMQYLVSVIDDKSNSGTDEEMAAIDVFNAGVQAAGHWVFAGGLASPDSATVIDNRDDAGMVTDGPFVETKEYVAGFWVFEAPDLDVALELAAGGSRACNRKVEVRPFL